MSQSSEWEGLLRDASEFTTGSEGLDQLLRSSLQAGFSQDPVTSRTLRDLDLRNDAEMDVHLHGESEELHVSRADLLGRFLKETTDAVKQIAKDLGGLRRHASNLWVQAPSAGSMRLILRTVEPKRAVQRPGTVTLPGAEGRTLDAMAVLSLAALMEQSTEDGLDSPLTAAIKQFRAPARNAVASLAKVVDEANWQLDGCVMVRGREPVGISFGVAEARRLYSAAKTESEDTDPVTIEGQIDGWAWSRSTLRFIPDTGRPFDASVPTTSSVDVARIGADPRNRVRATFLVTTIYPEGATKPKGRSFALQRLEVVAGAQAQDLTASESQAQDPMV